MLSSSEINQLIEPLFARSRFSNSIAGFTDRAADFVLERLGAHSQFLRMNLPSQLKYQEIQWVDEKVKKFFDRVPSGQCIEVSAGLSTRFHRVCDQSDWPKFSWQIIDRPEINNCLQYVFQSLENFRSIASETPEQAWSQFLGWNNLQSTILVIGECRSLTQGELISEVLPQISTLDTKESMGLEIIVFHSPDSLRPVLASGFHNISLVDENTNSGKSPLLNRLTSLLSLNRCPRKTMISHLRLN